MMTEPKILTRDEQPYVGIRKQVTVQELGPSIPQLLGETFGWLEKRGVPPAGPPFLRYYVIDMAAQLDVEIGVPVANGVAGDEHVTSGSLPAGRYAALVYTGIANGFVANATLIGWGTKQGLTWDSRNTEKGEAFGARYESYLTDPAVEPDQAKWETEVAIRLAD